jgi:hypothetical protein
MLQDLDLAQLRRMPSIAHYFRYTLHHSDFREFRLEGCLRGYYAAKPLYGRLTPEGRVDRSAGFDGGIAVVFIPAGARTAQAAKLLLTHIDPAHTVLPDNRRNWQAIRAAAERRLMEMLHLAA